MKRRKIYAKEIGQKKREEVMKRRKIGERRDTCRHTLVWREIEEH